jgi:hypothetical protein
MTYKKSHVFLDPKTGLLTRKTRLLPKRKGKRSSRSPSKIFKGLGDLFDLKFRKKP